MDDDLMETHLGMVIDLDEAKRRYNLAPIVRRYGTWAVTEYGLECMVADYKIARDQVRSEHWFQEMLQHNWCVPVDFADALDGGRAYFSGKLQIIPEHSQAIELERAARRRAVWKAGNVTPSMRFRILKRDGYRCQLCGATPQDGATLEIDHKVPRSDFGPTTPDNLWTLCWTCNRGKGAEAL